MTLLVAGLEGVLKSPGSLEQHFPWGNVGCTQQDVNLQIRHSGCHSPARNHLQWVGPESRRGTDAQSGVWSI